MAWIGRDRVLVLEPRTLISIDHLRQPLRPDEHRDEPRLFHSASTPLIFLYASFARLSWLGPL